MNGDELERERVDVARARTAFERQAWRTAFAEYGAADRAVPLEPGDLERFSAAALLIGRDADSNDVLVRAHHEFKMRGDAEGAARCGTRLALLMFTKGDMAQGAGWLARARRVLDDSDRGDCAVRGYFFIPTALRAVIEGDTATAFDAFSQAVAIGERFGDNDLVILARHGQGRVLVRTGKVADGLALFDEIMVAIAAGEASPLVVGDVYCSVITACSDIFDFHRAREWTDALDAWCARQPDLVAHRGECMVRRAELTQFHGAWSDAMSELLHASERLRDPPGQRGVGAAFYQQGELHRLRGEFDKAEEMYRAANEVGFIPQPGLALLRIAQHRLDSAVASIRGALDDARSGSRRARVLSAYVEIMLAANDTSAARVAADELREIATNLSAPFLRGASAHASGAICISDGNLRGAVGLLREALTIWHELDAPYEAARTRELLAAAHGGLGDSDTAAMELDAAVRTLTQLGAATDLARIDTRARPSISASAAVLTARELEVLRLIATGKTNRAIAATLSISDKTVARHVSNIFMKLGLSSRSAATAYAYEHDLAATT